MTNKTKRKIIIDTGALHTLGSDESIFKVLNESGINCYDYSLYWKGVTEHIGVDNDYKEKAFEVRKLADKYGLICEQTHGYFTRGITDELIQKRTEYISNEIEISSILGSKAIVIHPILEWNTEQNVKWIKNNFLELAHKYNIKLAIENVWNEKDGHIIPMCTSKPKDIVKFIDSFNDDYVVACLDIGHAEMKDCGTNAVDMIKALGPRLYCLHIHDNDKEKDHHQVPYTHGINFNNILLALKEIGYKGNITFEVETCFSHGWDPTGAVPFELFPSFLRLLKDIGNYYIKKLDE